VRRRTPRHRNVFTHLTAAVVVPACIALCWWQVTRALSGNTLSWAYVFEWPIFAGYAVFMWWKLIHEPGPAGRSVGPETSPMAVTRNDDHDMDHHAHGEDDADDDTGGEDEELASYNRYLAALNASGKRKHW
jgi:hypothetical protein